MKMLSRAEEIILLSILQLEGNAYGISIRDFIKEVTGTEWSFAQIYDPLTRLTRKSYVTKFTGDSTPERGGRHKCLYSITKEGKIALKELRHVQDSLWEKAQKKLSSGRTT
jgi:DNA-binding PadR family transcriptional regulator